MSAEWQMSQDKQLLDALSSQTDLVTRFYEWRAPTITYGCFIDPQQYLKAEIPGFEMAKRPTGGGMLFHIHDFPFTVAVPKNHPKFSEDVLENYRFVNEAVVKAIREVLGEHPFQLQERTRSGDFNHFCMATPTRYDILMQGYKIGGAAQRKTAHGFVHQGALFLEAPPWDLLREYLHNGDEAVASMQQTAAFLALGSKRVALQQAIKIALST